MTKPQKSQNNFIILGPETIKQSIISDIFTIFVFIVPLLLNRFVLGDKWYIDVFFLFSSFLWIVGGSSIKSKKFKSKKEAIEYINNL
jgi:hypothetical protein